MVKTVIYYVIKSLTTVKDLFNFEELKKLTLDRLYIYSFYACYVTIVSSAA